MCGKLGQKGTRVLYENDDVRVWEIELAQNETLKMHHHDLDYVVISVTGGQTTVTWDDGRKETNVSRPGSITWRKAPHTHELHNDGRLVYRNRMIELKRPA